MADRHFDDSTGERRIKEFFGIQTLKSFEIGDMRVAIGAANALLDYLNDKKRR